MGQRNGKKWNITWLTSVDMVDVGNQGVLVGAEKSRRAVDTELFRGIGRRRSSVRSQAIHRTTEGRRYILSLKTRGVAAQFANRQQASGITR
jgi:hypothetical protein